ncbi:MAG: rod shape-determining protein MreC [Candidatus Nealsonbacteria bacterium RIFCSPLOWO2_01_FULL_43_32]|uniref:Cell shape-determining protein MreC n=1 Tax=Candidatus Nealsonbacteria bacterium RIFCSPLOWO2_01_FULL_43_32 TaxID=1801672 RepID=A0A1G2EFD3_9BACT|nr:MAG: rod shape-determining protein MreC [Candidatus Nealsonbacteria bacterium RIFCSPLOWO2_01_FULL_43_32]
MKSVFKKNKILVVIVVGILLVLSLNFFQKTVKGFFYATSAPVQKSLEQTGSNATDFFSGVFRSKELKKENEELELNIQILLAENASLKEIQEENQVLRGALEIGLQKDFRLALAEITSQDIGQGSILINQGSKDGLNKGMPVITQQKVLLGRITEIYEDFSRVALISSKESSFDAEVLDRGASGVVKGKSSQLLTLDLVVQDKEIKEGDVVVSASLGGIYPKGLLVGLVQEVKRSDTDPFYQIAVVPFFDLQRTNSVLIILDF